MPVEEAGNISALAFWDLAALRGHALRATHDLCQMTGQQVLCRLDDADSKQEAPGPGIEERNWKGLVPISGSRWQASRRDDPQIIVRLHPDSNCPDSMLQRTWRIIGHLS